MEKDKGTEGGFSFGTIKGFDKHIAESIPDYSGMLSLVMDISEYFIEKDTNVYDIGCSTGKLVKELAAMHPNSHIIGIDYEDNFKKYLTPTLPNIEFLFDDITKVEAFPNASMITLLFTLQFLPIYCRLPLLRKVYDGLVEGGSLVICEKTLTSNVKIQDIMTFMYYDYKREHFTDASILDKEKSLRSKMKPSTLDYTIGLLKNVGFTSIEVFWKKYIFTGILAIKE